MAGIGFQLERLGRDGGVGGVASAAIHGAVVSSGPWLLTIFGVLALQQWTDTMSPEAETVIQTVMVYAFSASIVISAPVSLVSVRIASDRMFAGNRDAVPGVLLAALCWGTLPALIAGSILFGFAAGIPPLQAVLATAVLTVVTQISIAAPFLTATKRHRPILAAYVTGIGAAAAVIAMFGIENVAALLLTIIGGLAVTMMMLLAAIRGEFSAPPPLYGHWNRDARRMVHIGLAGLAGALAVWTDKWLLWGGADSIATLGALRLNAINDQGSFLGLLTIVPGLTLMLIISETRFERAFTNLMIRCTGTSKLDRIESARQKVGLVILRDLRLLVVVQGVIAAICWVLAPEFFRLLGLDARGIFAFRFTAVGVIFHVVAIYSTVILSYYDLFGRILAIWTLFVAVSAIATLATADLGFASFGWGYLAGGMAAVSLALALLSEATVRLTYLLFVGNNPAVVGQARYWV